VPIIKTDKEYLEDAPSASEVKDVPGNFKKWVEDNEERIAAARKRDTEPYFLRDNAQQVDGILNAGSKLTPLQIAELQRWSNNHTEYLKLKADNNYKDVEFNPANGGLRATHVKHIIHSSKKEETFFGGKTSSDLELQCQQEVFNSGHSCILLQEGINLHNGRTLPALDMLLDGVLMDIRSITQGKSHYGSPIKTKLKQLRNFNIKTNNNASNVCLYFYDESMYTKNRILDGISWIQNNYPNDMSALSAIYVVIRGKGLQVIKMADTR
jgi:hypothetical protein